MLPLRGQDAAGKHQGASGLYIGTCTGPKEEKEGSGVLPYYYAIN